MRGEPGACRLLRRMLKRRFTSWHIGRWALPGDGDVLFERYSIQTGLFGKMVWSFDPSVEMETFPHIAISTRLPRRDGPLPSLRFGSGVGCGPTAPVDARLFHYSGFSRHSQRTRAVHHL